MRKAVQTKNAVIGVTIDKEKLKAAAEGYLNASAVYGAVKSLATFSLGNLGEFWRNIVAMVMAVIASVELARAKLVEGQPEGTKISGVLAAEAAISILDEAITFTGIAGKLLEVIDGPVLKLLVNIVLGPRHGINWIDEAWDILGLREN